MGRTERRERVSSVSLIFSRCWRHSSRYKQPLHMEHSGLFVLDRALDEAQSPAHVGSCLVHALGRDCAKQHDWPHELRIHGMPGASGSIYQSQSAIVLCGCTTGVTTSDGTWQEHCPREFLHHGPVFTAQLKYRCFFRAIHTTLHLLPYITRPQQTTRLRHPSSRRSFGRIQGIYNDCSNTADREATLASLHRAAGVRAAVSPRHVRFLAGQSQAACRAQSTRARQLWGIMFELSHYWFLTKYLPAIQFDNSPRLHR